MIPPILGVHSLLGWLIPYEHETLNILASADNLGLVLALWFSSVVAAPDCEEFFYRGAFQGWLQRFPGGRNEGLSKWLLGEDPQVEATSADRESGDTHSTAGGR